MSKIKNYTLEQLYLHDKGLKEDIKDFIENLPQARAIEERDSARWLDRTASLDVRGDGSIDTAISQLWWHMKRLRGIGGSDIGDIMSYRMGETPGFNTPKELYASKVMRLAPTNGDSYTRRGIKLEDFVAELFLEDYDVERDQKTIDKIALKSGTLKGYEFLIGNIDDAVVDDEGFAYIVDYKAPSEVPSEPPFAYIAQLHLYDLILNDGETPSNRMADVFLDYASGKVVPKEVPRDDELSENIKNLGLEFWSAVCDPNVKELPSVWSTNQKEIISDVTITPEEIDELAEIEEMAFSIKALETELANLKGKMQEKAQGIVASSFGLKNGIAKSDLTIRSTLKIKDPDALTSLLKDRVDIESLMKSSASFDNDKVKEFLMAENVSLEHFRKKNFDEVKVISLLEELGFDPQEYVSQSISAYPKTSKSAKLTSSELAVKASMSIEDALDSLSSSSGLRM